MTDAFVYSTPDRYVEYGGAILHELSYQLASHYCVPCRGVYVADPAGGKLKKKNITVVY